MERELKTMTDERNFYQDIANDYTQLQDEYQNQRSQLERLRSTGADGDADVAQQSMRMEGRAVEEKGADVHGDTDLKKYREMTRQLLQTASQHNDQLKKENEELREELRAYSADVDVDDITPEQRAVVRMALQKQARVYRQREKDLQKRILELENQLRDPVDVSAAIDEAVREVVKRASDMQIRLKGENAALRKRIRDLTQDEADDEFENIEDVVKASIEGSDTEFRELMEEVEMLRAQMIVAQSMRDRSVQAVTEERDVGAEGRVERRSARSCR